MRTRESAQKIGKEETSKEESTEDEGVKKKRYRKADQKNEIWEKRHEELCDKMRAGKIGKMNWMDAREAKR